MKKITSLFIQKTFLLFTLLITNLLSAQDWQWSKGVGGVNNDGAKATATDQNGNVIVTGYFNNVGEDFFLIKYNSTGNIIWSKYASGLGDEKGNSVACDSVGNIYVTGNFSSPMLIFGTDTLRRIGNKDIFIVKYDAGGNPIWAKSPQGTIDTDEESNSINVDLNGDVLITGSFGYDTLTFGSIDLINPGVFIAKYDSLGNVILATSSASAEARSFGVSTDGAGNIFICGVFAQSFGFGSITLNNSDTWGSTYDMFVFKFSPTGTPIWGKRAGSFDRYEWAYGIVADSTGNVYITGSFTDLGISFGSYSLVTNGAADSYIVKYSPTGTVLWAKSAGGSNLDVGTALTLDNKGNIYQTGNFMTNITFGMFALNNPTPGTFDIFITKYDSTGNVLWAKSEGGENTDYSSGISVSLNKDVYIVGQYTSTDLAFGNNVPLINSGINDAFIAKYRACTDVNYVPICMVTVDSLSQYNIITWDKTGLDNSVDSFIIYREIQTNLYLPIGAVPFDSMSYFIDTCRTLYFPTYFSTGDPNGTTYRYKMAVRDTCGNISQKSAFHNTIHITNNAGTFEWQNLYSIEGQTGPVANSYILMRDDFANGNWHGVNSVSGTQQTITDPNYAAYQATADWRIETGWNIICNPTLRITNPDNTETVVVKSKSNIKNNRVIGAKGLEKNLDSKINVYPNPTNTNLTIELFNSKATQTNYEFSNMLGQIVLSNTTGKNKFTIDVSLFPKGIYFLTITNASEKTIKKIIIE